MVPRRPASRDGPAYGLWLPTETGFSESQSGLIRTDSRMVSITACCCETLGPTRRLRRSVVGQSQMLSPFGQTGAMTGRAELTRRAQAQGVAVSYQNWRGQVAEVADEMLAAVLDALGDDGFPAGSARSRERAEWAASTAVAPFPRSRSWGFAVQLYSLRSRASWATATCATWPTWPGSGDDKHPGG
jgi:hypothetical protein